MPATPQRERVFVIQSLDLLYAENMYAGARGRERPSAQARRQPRRRQGGGRDRRRAARGTRQAGAQRAQPRPRSDSGEPPSGANADTRRRAGASAERGATCRAIGASARTTRDAAERSHADRRTSRGGERSGPRRAEAARL